VRFFKYIVFLSFILISCENDLETEKINLINVDKSFALTAKKIGTANAFKKFLSDDAIQIVSGKETKGKLKIYENLKNSFSSELILNWEPEGVNVAESGELGYTWGSYVVMKKGSIKDQISDEIIFNGKYLNIWEKIDNGSWKVKIDIGSISQF